MNKITPEDIENAIASEHYFTAADGVIGESGHDFDARNVADPLKLLTFCVLVLKNGYTVTGESACAAPENFDAEMGRRLARSKAEDKVWALLGYELKTKLAAEKPAVRYTPADIIGYETNHTYGGLWVKFKDGRIVEVDDDHPAVAETLHELLYKACVKANTSA